jgi:hypothetical protein
MNSLHVLFSGRLPGSLLLLAFAFSGCILIRTTEHRVKLKEDLSGEATMRLIDLRSDGTADSTVEEDFRIMMSSFEGEGIKDFEKEGRKVTDRRFVVSGDTLSAEISYTFSHFGAVEGLHITKDEIYVLVGEGREVPKTNGKLTPGADKTTRIVWARSARRLLYQIMEKDLQPSVSLAQLYLKYSR